MQTSIRHSPLTISRAVPSSAKAAAQHRQRLPTVPVHLPSSPQTGGVRTAAAATETASPPAGAVDWSQKTFSLPSKSRGCHIVTRDVISNLPELGRYEMGMLNLFGLYLNEHRDHGGARRVVATIQGKLRADGKEYGKSLWGR